MSGIHDGHVVTDVLHHAEVVRDKQIGQPEVILEFAEQVEDLGLDGHVQGRTGSSHMTMSGLSARARAHGQPLALPAAEFMGVAVMWSAPSDHLQKLHDSRALFPAMSLEMNFQGHADDRLDLLPRVQGSERTCKTIWMYRLILPAFRLAAS